MLRALANRNEQALGDLEAMGFDKRALVESSGDLELIEALRFGADSIDARSIHCTEDFDYGQENPRKKASTRSSNG